MSTISQKILASHSDKEKVEPGEIVKARVDLAMMPALTAVLAFRAMEDIGVSKVWDPEKEYPVIHGLGRTLELNVEGATVEMADELPVGAIIQLELAMGEVITPLKGEVKNIQPSESGLYRIGIEFLKPSTVHLE